MEIIAVIIFVLFLPVIIGWLCMGALYIFVAPLVLLAQVALKISDFFVPPTTTTTTGTTDHENTPNSQD